MAGSESLTLTKFGEFVLKETQSSSCGCFFRTGIGQLKDRERGTCLMTIFVACAIRNLKLRRTWH
jgi:hypothetical protein